MVKVGIVSGGDLTAQEAINSYKSRYSNKYKNFRAFKLDSGYKVSLTKRDGKTVSKLVYADTAEDAKRIALKRNRGFTALGVKLWRNEYVVYADHK